MLGPVRNFLVTIHNIIKECALIKSALALTRADALGLAPELSPSRLYQGALSLIDRTFKFDRTVRLLH